MGLSTAQSDYDFFQIARIFATNIVKPAFFPAEIGSYFVKSSTGRRITPGYASALARFYCQPLD